jgi:thioredoxin-dependent peroxiredoxin
MTSCTVGTVAPAFSLRDQDDRLLSSSDLRGQWVVLYFYPRDDTPGCTTEACEFSSDLAAFADLGATVLGCSPDPPGKHQRFIAKHALGVRLLSDPEHATMAAYGAWGEKKLYGKVSQGVIRSTVIIDPAGRLAYRWPKVSAKGHAAQVKDKLAELQRG